MDVLFHVHRIARCLADFPLVASVDSYSHAGTPWHLHWPGPHELLYAAVAKIVRAPDDDLLALASALSWVPPLLGAVTAGATVLLARAARFGEAAAVGAGLLCAVSGDALVAFHHGAIDHHAFAALGLTLALLSWLRRTTAALLGWFGSLLLLLATTPEATPYLTLVLLAAAACEGVAAARSDDPAPRPWAFFLAPSVAAAVAWGWDRALDPQPDAILTLDPFRLSIFQPAWLLLLGLAGGASAAIVRRGRTRGERLLALGGVALGAASLLLLGMLATGRLGPILDRLQGGGRQQVGEELSLLRFVAVAATTHWAAWAVLLALALLAALVRLAVAMQRSEPARVVLVAVVLAGATGLALLEIRHARSLAPLVAMAIAAAIASTIDALRQGGFVRTRTGAALALGWLLLLAITPTLWHALELRRVLRHPATWPARIGELCAFARASLPDAGPRDRVPSRAVFGPWEWGHHLNVLGGQPVLVDGFNHEESTNEASWECWLAGTEAQMVTAAQRRGATHVVVTSAACSIVGLLQRTPYEIVRRADVPGGVLFMPALRRHFAFRFDEAGGLADEEGRLLPLWISPATHPMSVLDGEVRVVPVPVSRLFEIVPGAEVSGTAPGGSMLLMAEWRVSIGGKPALTIVRRVPIDDARRFAFRTALPAPWASGTVRIDEPCILRAGDAELRLVVSPDAVRRGLPVILPPDAFPASP